MASQSPAQMLLARTPATPSTAQTSASTSSRPRHAASSSIVTRLQHVPSGPLSIHATFLSNARNPGTVKVTVENSVFYLHRDILSFASSFWEALLDPEGGWLETASDAGTSLVGGVESIGIPGRRWSRQAAPSPHRQAAQLAQTDMEETDRDALTPNTEVNTPFISNDPDADTPTVAASFVEDMAEMGIEVLEVQTEEELVGHKTPYEDYRKKVEARVTLKEEKAAPFQDLLFFIYPHLECVIHWNNVAELTTMAEKYDVPLLRRQCVSFLLASAAGKPVTAMKVAEDHALPDLYREASRFLLDSWSVWEASDLAVLSDATLLKLEKRRSWFLERLLKLGLINTQRDYVCCPNCPDAPLCGRMLDEKWRSAWGSAFRYGSPTPSNIWRSLRMLEPSLSSPALHLPHTSCQNHARAWVADLFDRMFSLGVPTQRTFALSASASRAPFHDPASNKKYFLYVDWKSQ